jgi:hypothetical protein
MQAFSGPADGGGGCGFIAGMIERIVNADVKKEKLESLSTVLQVLIPKAADGGARPVAIANTIVKLAPLLPRQGRFREDLRVVIFSITMRSRPHTDSFDGSRAGPRQSIYINLSFLSV